jgi:hypothetical protein
MPLVILLPFNLVGDGDGMIITELNLHLIYQLIKDFINAFVVKKLIFIFFKSL